MKATRLFVALAAAGLMFSCAKDNSTDQNKGPLNVEVSVKSVKLTRSVQDPVSAGYTTPINNATVFFLNSSGNIVQKETLTGASQLFTGVNGTTASVYILANTKKSDNSELYPGLASLGVGGTRAQIEALTAGIETQMGTSAIGVENVVLSGEASIVVDGGIPNYKADVTVVPAVCRLELTSIKCKNDVTSFSLKGVYVYNTFPQFTVSGLSAGTISGAPQTVISLTGVPASMKDAPLTFTGADMYTNPGSAVWAYMLPVATSNPRVVFEISDEVVNGVQQNTDSRFINVSKFVKDGTQTEITLERGHVYRVTSVEFEGENIDIVPNQEKINVTANVTVLPWTIDTVNPQW